MKKDSDGDGLPDDWETYYNVASPTADEEPDQLTNSFEYLLNLNPNSSDTDGDGVLDGDEDTDGDGVSNYQEILNGTDPSIASPRLTITKTGNGSGAVTSDKGTLAWNGNTGTENYTSAISVILTATANTGSTFTGWSGGGCSGTGTCMVTVSTSQSITATFVLNSKAPTVAGATPTNNTTPTWGWVSGGAKPQVK